MEELAAGLDTAKTLNTTWLVVIYQWANEMYIYMQCALPAFVPQWVRGGSRPLMHGPVLPSAQ